MIRKIEQFLIKWAINFSNVGWVFKDAAIDKKRPFERVEGKLSTRNTEKRKEQFLIQKDRAI